MARWRVKVKRTDIHEIEVDADSFDAAMDAGEAAMCALDSDRAVLDHVVGCTGFEAEHAVQVAS